MKEGTVLFIERSELIERHGLVAIKNYKGMKDSVSIIYQADLILCGDKVLKNRWGKPGLIVSKGEVGELSSETVDVALSSGVKL
jgi:hypothetical protein